MEIQIPYVIPQSTQQPKRLTLVPNDPGSRYKTRQLQVQIVGKSKMIKTVLLNILDVAKDMQVPPSYIGTFMGYVIGAQAKFDSKKPERQQAFLSGEHDPKDLSKIMLAFINEVLLCPVCGLPEILMVPEQKSVYGTCRACGAHSELRITDEKFKKYVQNHPPSHGKGSFEGNQSSAKKDTSKPQKKEDKAEKESKESVEPKVKREKKEKREEEIVWLSDTSEEAVKRRREEMLPDTVNIAVKSSKVSVEDLISALKGVSLKDASAVQQVKTEKNADDQTFVTALLNTLFVPEADGLAECKANSAILSEFIRSKEEQIALLSTIENFCGNVNTSQLQKVPLILKELYDKEILEEDSIIAWSDKDKNVIAAVRDQAAPMIKWLKEAEEESEGDEDDE